MGFILIRWLAYLGGWTLFALFFISQGAGRLLSQGRTVQWHGYLVVWLTTADSWALLAPLVWWLAARLPIARKTWWCMAHFHLSVELLLCIGRDSPIRRSHAGVWVAMVSTQLRRYLSSRPAH